MVTREDVAKKAGVSVSAVSRTMNGRGYVAKEKKEAIYKAVKELGYRPNPISNSLKTKQTHQLCFFNSDMSNSFYIDLYKYISAYAEQKGYTVFLLSTFNQEQIKTMLMDGMIIASEKMAREIEGRLGEFFCLPMVSAAAGLPEVTTKRISYVNVDTYDAMEMAIGHMKTMGHKKIAFATPFGKGDTGILQSRLIAYENIMQEELGSKYNQYLIRSNEHDRAVRGFDSVSFFEEGIRGADEFHGRNLDATSIICFNDEFALGMILQLKNLGYQIPEDVSIMGIDGISNRKYTVPLLTTISLNREEQAKACVDILIDKIEGRKPISVTSINPYLLKGESVKKLR